jgi:ABC-type nickel/cobalt efflux system permease component RcnA
VGVRPCSGAIIVLVFALSQGLFAAGIASAIVMGLGTGLTVATLAMIAVGARGVAVRLARTNSAVGVNAVRGLEIVAAAGVMLFGLTMLGGAIAGGLPT